MISIVIPTKNDLQNLKRLFHSLDSIPKGFEVIVVDSCSNDGTEELVKSKKYAKFIEAKSTPGKARNIGVKHAKYSKIAMLDADTEVNYQWLREAEWSLNRFDIVAGYSPGYERKQLPRVPIYVNGQDITYPQCNIAYKKHIFLKVGYLREDMSVAEDCEFHYRCAKHGLTIFYNPKMKAIHYERSTRRQWIQKQIKNGFGRYELEKIHPNLRHGSQHGLKITSIVRLGFAALGYMKGKIFGGKIKT